MFRIKLAILFVLISTVSAYSYTPFSDNQDYFKRHLNTDVYALDSQASAIVLYDWGEYVMSDITTTGMKYHIKYRRVIKILTEGGLREADISIPFYAGGDARPAKVVAKTYSLENGELKVTELDAKAITVDVVNNYYKLLKFSFPSVSPGVVIDYSFEMEQAPLFNFVDWNFQDELPVLHSEVTATYLDEFSLSVITKTSVPFVPITNKEILTMQESEVPLAYQLPTTSFSGRNTLRFVRRNIRAMIEEDFNYCYDNYTDKVDIYLMYFPGLRNGLMSPWRRVNSEMKGNFADFINGGSARAATRNMLEKIFTKKYATALDSAKRIHSYVRSSFTTTYKGWSNLQYSDFTRIVEKRKGSSVEINLVLYKLLTDAGINANMVILSTRENPRLFEDYPVTDNMNYAVCRAEINGLYYLLDASEKYTPFGVMQPRCYNGYAWVVTDTGYAINISPDSIKEQNSTVVMTEKNDADDYIVMMSQNFGDISAMKYKKEWKQDSLTIKTYLKNIVKGFTFDSELLSYQVSGLEDIDEKLKLTFRLKITFPDVDKLFIIPSMFNFYESNPFKANKRYLPIEMPYAVNYYYTLLLTLPEKYTAADVPNSMVCKIDDKNFYKYQIAYQEANNTISMSTILNLNTTYFDAVNYSSLQTFFNTIITQQGKTALISKKTE